MSKEHSQNAHAAACKFNVGDRVMAYDHNGGKSGAITQVCGQFYMVSVPNAGIIPLRFHEKQLRRLKPRNRREWLICPNPLHEGAEDGYCATVCSCTRGEKPKSCARHECIRVREVKP